MAVKRKLKLEKILTLSRKIFIHLLLILGLAITLAPFIWMISTSFKSSESVFTFPPQWIPKHPTTEQYQRLFREVNFLQFFKNSVIIAFGITLFSLFLNSLGGFAFAKYRFPGKEKIFALLLATLMVPAQITMIPVFLMLKTVGLINSYWGLIIPAGASAFGIFLMRQFITTIPNDLIESARIDGCSEFRIYWTIILPLCKPVVAALGIFTFMGSWNAFLWPLIIMIKENMYTLPVALANLSGQYATKFGLLMAGAVVVVAPVIIVFIIAQRYVIKGVAVTGLKQ
ncbi:MAG: carbohydrate ABC transporter permease [Elusimicrobiota bacterium]|nr:carbohydrate ABC transporter permease [Elusimicrobiota bacterium]